VSPGKANRLGETGAAFMRVVTLGFGACGGEAVQAEVIWAVS
jgi:hypothetical protein